MNDDTTVDPTARDCDEDLSCWDEGADAPTYSESTDHPLSEPLHLVAECAEALQTWASDLASELRRRGGRMTLEEVEAGRRLSLQITESVIVALYVGRNM